MPLCSESVHGVDRLFPSFRQEREPEICHWLHNIMNSHGIGTSTGYDEPHRSQVYQTCRWASYEDVGNGFDVAPEIRA